MGDGRNSLQRTLVINIAFATAHESNRQMTIRNEETALRDDECLVYIGALKAGEQGNSRPVKYYARFFGDDVELVTLSKRPAEHIRVLSGKDATRFLKDRGYKIDRSIRPYQLAKRQRRVTRKKRRKTNG